MRVATRAEQRALSRRDQRILALTRCKLGGSPTSFAEALRGLREAVAEQIPSGRTFLLGTSERHPIVGSILSGVGLCEGLDGVVIVRVDRMGRHERLGVL